MNKNFFAAVALWLMPAAVMPAALNAAAAAGMPASVAFRAEANVGQYVVKISPLICGVKIAMAENPDYSGSDRLTDPEVAVIDFMGDEVARFSLADRPDYLVSGLKFDHRYKLRFSGCDAEGVNRVFAEESFNTSRPTFTMHFASTPNSIKLRRLEVKSDESIVPTEIGVYYGEEKYPFTGETILFDGLESDQTLYVTPYVIYNGGADEFKGTTTDVKTTDVEIVEAPELPAAYIDMQGRRHAEPQPGLNIVLYPDGTTRKILR